MGYDIHTEITTKLHYKDVVCICASISHYMNTVGKLKGADSDIVKRMNKLMNRLYGELDMGLPWED